MNGCINIADFRCRALPAVAPFRKRLSRRPNDFAIVAPESGWKAWEPEMPQDAVVQEDPTVYDIGVVREARSRHRAVFRPMSMQRKAKVLRFRNEEPVPITMRAEERPLPYPDTPDEPRDLPPAA